MIKCTELSWHWAYYLSRGGSTSFDQPTTAPDKKRSFKVLSYANRFRFLLCKILRMFGTLVLSLILRCLRTSIKYYLRQMPVLCLILFPYCEFKPNQSKCGPIYNYSHRHHYHQVFFLTS
uniref:Uncharacterized protein n=1 Tax=Glossina palpalis gambiensis TaxID=67801 RepID=A0A1B0BXI3_9MUSC